MAARQTTKPTTIGSFSWIANERSTVQQLGEQDVEDFAFSARNDLEWLNEHMADIFERNHVDMAELLKTPGRLRGKTPGTGRKQIRPGQGREPLANIPDINQPATSRNSSENPFYNAITQLPSNKEVSPTRGLSKSPARSLRVLQDVQAKKPVDPMKDSSISLSQAEASQISIADSGIWSASSDSQSQQTQQSEFPSQRVSLSSENFNTTGGGGRDSTYRTAPEDSSDPPQQQSPVQTKNTVPSPSPPPPQQQQQPKPKPRTFKLASDIEKTVPAQQPSAKSESPPKNAAKKPALEPRRSGRLAERSSSPLVNNQMLSDGPNDIVPPSSPPNVSHQGISATKEEGEEDEEEEGDASTLPAAKPPTSPPAPTRSARPQTPTRSPTQVAESPKNTPAAQTPEAGRSSPSRSSSESPAPEIPIVRKSILNFASLPAREPLTNKKKSLGVKNTRDSHVEQVRLNGASRASWMNRKGNGKSLGASSKQIERIENGDEHEEEQAERSDLPKNLKRKSENVRGDSRKKSKGNIDDMEEEESSGETAKAMALHNKTSTQRLHDKIQQLGKLNASREARSFPSSVSQSVNLAYPDLPQAEQDPVQEAPVSKRTKSDPQGQLPHNGTVGRWTSQTDEEDWIPMKVEPKRQLTRSNTEGMIGSKQKEVEPERPQSANRWNNSPKSFQAPQSIPVRTMTTSESAPNLRSPTTIRHVPSSPLKSSFSEDWVKAPASPSRPPGEGAISAVKAHTSSVFKKAKEMLLKSSVSSASAKIETMSPALRSWQGGHNLREQSRNDASSSHSQESTKQPEQQLYPDLGSVMATEAEGPSSAKDLTVGHLEEARQTRSRSEEPENPVVETPAEPFRNTRQTRSSRSKDTRDGSPEIEELTPKIQKKSKAAERAEREERLREREEKLRQAEEELRLAKEEQRREEQRKQQEEQRKQQEEQLRQAQEELCQAQEQQRKHREEQARREKEESKRRQEERLRQEKEELRRRQQEELKRQQEESRKAAEIPASFQDDEDYTDKEEEDAAEEINRTRVTSSAEPDRPPSRLQKAGGRFQKTGDNKRPLRPATASKEQLKPKVALVSISVGTASQREMQSQRSKPNMVPSTSTLVAALKQSFENPSQTGNSSQVSLNMSSSTNSLRSSNPGGPSKQLKSLTAAANQLKKEQEEKERKLAAKREIERRRLENQRKLEEETRKARQKQAPPSIQKTLSRTQTVANLRQTSEEPERRLDPKSSVNNKPAPAKTAAKRVFQPEATEDQQQYRQAPPRPGAPAYQQEGAKKRKTGEYDERPYEMAPPIRQSVAKKEIMSKSAMPHGYAQVPTQASSSSVPSMLRPPTKPGAPQVEAVKFSKDKIRFANDVAPGSSAGPQSAFKTPGAKSASKMHMLKTPVGVKDSPIYQNGELIELPDIPTDSEDEDDDYPPKDNFHVPQWAESPELRQLLRQQQTVNPEEIFGPMARLDMEAIFQNRTDRQASRFRARTSSANWSGADRLTPAEIEADQEARRKMIEQGGWKFQPPS